MNELANSTLFTSVQPEEDAPSFYILDRKVAPVQQGFYFVNDSMSADGRYLWFYCGFPPSRTRTLGVVDLEQDSVRHFPETQFGAASPYVDPDSGDAYWMTGRMLWKRGPQVDSSVERINAVPEELVGERGIQRSATHLTLSADGKEFLVDMGVGLKYIFGSIPLDGGDFEVWHRFDRNYNHAQFSPTDSDLVLFAQENHRDPITGLKIPIENRMWLIKRGEGPQPIFDEPVRVSHEWWDADGEHVWCVQGNDTWRVNIQTSEVEKISFPHHCWHSHNSRGGRYIVGDSNTNFYRGCRSGVHFLNRDTDELVTLVENPEQHNYVGRNYHIDPHPRFCCNDRYVVFTTTIRDEVDLAIMPVQTLIDYTT
jgi:hypothetical protein